MSSRSLKSISSTTRKQLLFTLALAGTAIYWQDFLKGSSQIRLLFLVSSMNDLSLWQYFDFRKLKTEWRSLWETLMDKMFI